MTGGQADWGRAAALAVPGKNEDVPLSGLGLAILSWRSPKSLANVLKRLDGAGIWSLFEDRLIYFQEIQDSDHALAESYGLRYAGNERNRGILGGMKAAVSESRCEYLLYLENDCVLLENGLECRRQLECALGYLRRGFAHVWRLRHRKNPGADFRGDMYRRYHGGRGYAWPICLLRRCLRPFKARRLAGAAVYFEDRPERCFPRGIQRTPEGAFLVDSSYINWTNQSILFRRSWFLETILPYAERHPRTRLVNGFPDVEKELNVGWWRRQGFKIGVDDKGLFTHGRLDRPPGDEKGV